MSSQSVPSIFFQSSFIGKVAEENGKLTTSTGFSVSPHNKWDI